MPNPFFQIVRRQTVKTTAVEDIVHIYDVLR